MGFPLVLLLAAAPVSVSPASLKTVNIDRQVGDFFTEHFVQQLSLQPGLKVISASDVAAVLGLERQKELLGCADANTSCLAELAGALGVDAIITGTIAKVGSAYTVNLRVLAAVDAKSLSVVSERATGDDALLELLGRLAERIGVEVRTALAPAGTQLETVYSPPPLRQRAWVPAVFGVASGVSGAVLLVLANITATKVSSGSREIATSAELDGAINYGRNLAAATVVMMSLGGAALVTAACFYFLGGKSGSASVSAWLSPTGGGLGLSGSLP